VRREPPFDWEAVRQLQHGYFLAIFSGGGYFGPQMREAHLQLGLTGEQFDALVTSLQKVLKQHAIEYCAQKEILVLFDHELLATFEDDNTLPIYKRLGGGQVAELLLSRLNSRLLGSPQLKSFFIKISPPCQERMTRAIKALVFDAATR